MTPNRLNRRSQSKVSTRAQVNRSPAPKNRLEIIGPEGNVRRTAPTPRLADESVTIQAVDAQRPESSGEEDYAAVANNRGIGAITNAATRQNAGDKKLIKAVLLDSIAAA